MRIATESETSNGKCIGFILFGFLFSAAGFPASGPAWAAAPHYKAEPVVAPSAGNVVTRDLLWRCGPGGCFAPQGNSRPAIECAALVREVGRLDSFVAGGRALTAEELRKCNARAR